MLKQSANVLFLVPSPISEGDINWSMPLHVIEQISSIQCFIAENAKTARYVLKKLNPAVNFEQINIFELNKHDLNSQLQELRILLKQNEQVGLMSEAGLPCIADPGNHVVRIAHELDIQVRPLTGPSSIILALIASGLNGQQFKFNGYLPAKPEEKKQAVLQLEKECFSATQLFIEAPYRNEKLLETLVQVLKPSVRLMLAIDISGDQEKIICKPVSWWKANRFSIGKVPCIFAIGQ